MEPSQPAPRDTFLVTAFMVGLVVLAAVWLAWRS